MATLADVVDQLRTQNQSMESLNEKIEQVIASNNDTLDKMFKKFSVVLRKISQQDNVDKLRQEEVRRESEQLKKLSLSEKLAEFGKGGGFAQGVSEGILGSKLSEFLSNFLGSALGTGGVLLTALPRLLGQVVGRLGLAGIVYAFGEQALSALFKQVSESAGFEFSDERIDSFASDATDGLMSAILVGLGTTNPFVKIGAFLTGYFKDEILGVVKKMFGITGNDEEGYTAKLPFMESIDLGDSMAAIEATITGVVTAIGGLLALFIARKFRGIPGMARRLLGLAPAAAGAGAGTVAAGAVAGSTRTVSRITPAQQTALRNIDDATLAAQGLARNTSGQIVRAGTNQFISNAEQLNLLAAKRAPRFGTLLGLAKKIPGLGTIITSGLAASIILDEELKDEEKVEELGGLLGSVLGGAGGAAIAGLVAGGLGLTTGPGALVTGAAGIVLGAFAGDWTGRQIASHLLGGEVATEIPPEVAQDISVSSQSFAGRAIAGQVYTPGTNLSEDQVRAVELDAAMGKLPDDQLLADYDRTITTGQYNLSPTIAAPTPAPVALTADELRARAVQDIQTKMDQLDLEYEQSRAFRGAGEFTGDKDTEQEAANRQQREFLRRKQRSYTIEEYETGATARASDIGIERVSDLDLLRQAQRQQMVTYDESGNRILLTNQEQAGYTGQLLAGEIPVAGIIEKLSDEGRSNNVVVNNYFDQSDNSTSTSMTSGGRGSGASTPLPSRDVENYDWVAP